MHEETDIDVSRTRVISSSTFNIDPAAAAAAAVVVVVGLSSGYTFSFTL